MNISYQNIFFYLWKREQIKNKIKGDKAAEIEEFLSEEEAIEEESMENWCINLKIILLNLNPYDFEKLALIILRESGFMEVEITKKSGNGGFERKGILLLNDLISLQIIFEYKRYKNSIGTDKIRSFRGAMEGWANKGLFIAKSTFIRGGWEEAVRKGAVLIDLIDEHGLIDLIKNLGLGVSVKTVERVEIDKSWFKSFQ